MSRLDSVIRRLQAQRACLDAAAGLISGMPGVVLELGLGNGRTYDHLRTRLPDRDIYVFDRQVAAHPDCIPPADRLFLGDLSETLPQAAARLGNTAILVHSDIGSGDEAMNREIAMLISRMLPSLLAPGAVILSDQLLTLPALPLPLPDGVPPGRYYMLQAMANDACPLTQR